MYAKHTGLYSRFIAMLAHMAFTVDLSIVYLYDEPNYSTLLTHFGERRPIDTAMVGDMLSTMVSLRRAGRRPGKAPRDLLLSVTFFILTWIIV